MICSFEECEKEVKYSGLCRGHYGQLERGQELRPLRQRIRGGRVCHCGKPAKARDLCQKHYDLQRENRYGTVEQRRERSLKFHYGMTLDEYEDLLNSQNRVCAICKLECKSGRFLAVDHDHDTGDVRGLLCANCNTAIGLMGDDPDRLINASKYLKMSQPQISSQCSQMG